MPISKRGIALFTAALMVTTSAFADTVKKEGVIITHQGDELSVRTREGPLTVVLNSGTEIKETSGIAKRKDRDAKTLIPGLIIKVEGNQDGSRFSAEKIEFKDRDWRSAIATKAGTQAEFAELRQAIIDGHEYVIREEATVYFATGSSAIGEQYKGQLRHIAQKAPSYGNYRVSILGFADPRGNAEANEKLSLKRSVAVSNFMRQTGHIQPGRVLSPSAMGEGTVAPGEKTPMSNDEARRVVVRIVTPMGQLTQ
jgi:outer membrane protein OmpA-like peptidoglycan-associated protein